MEQTSYVFKCPSCGCNDLLMLYACNSLAGYPVTKLVEGDIRKDRHVRQEIWHGMERFDGYQCKCCGNRYNNLPHMIECGAVVKFDV